ncbi:uncharacterized protein LOC121798222 [Salvia splendens]|uniref:uncharacterized protein LOC121798222 n=1 Tax=Salvia splendens TaxID=180675 RepID=UPI001C265A01|nr:uncharacterized protein LOC121798222 [Salvia splendens]
MEKVEDVLLHQKLLASAKDPDNQPVFHIRFLENFCTGDDDFEGEQISSALPASFLDDSVNNGVHLSNDSLIGNRNSGGDYETFSKLEDLNQDVRKDSNDVNKEISLEGFALRYVGLNVDFHPLLGYLMEGQIDLDWKLM